MVEFEGIAVSAVLRGREPAVRQATLQMRPEGRDRRIQLCLCNQTFRERERERNRFLFPAVSIACLLTFLLTVLAGAQIANASPTQWQISEGGNDHYYEVVADSGIYWSAAKTAAEAMTYLGQPGYLVTVTDEAENDFVTSKMAGIIWDGWAGGYQPEGAPEPAGGWQWVTGEPWVYTNWNSGEPNNNGNENVLQIFSSDNPSFPHLWNDNPEMNPFIFGYVVEYAPEPATLSLVAVGIGGLMLRRRRG